MKKISALILILLGASTISWAAAAPIKFDIYPQSAIVRFSSEVNGEQAIIIPGAFNPDSVKLVSISGANLLSFKAESISNEDNQTPYYLANAQKQLDMLNDTLIAKTSKQASLDLNNVILDSVTAENVKTAELPLLLSTVANLREKNAKELAALNKDILLLKEKIKNRQEKIKAKLPNNFNKLTQINVKLAGKGTIVFEAQTASASWEPKYKMNLNSSTGLIEVTFAASVKQNTGIAWKGDMEFYSNEPSGNIFYRRLPPLLVYLRSNMPVIAPRMMNSMAKGVSEMEEAAEADTLLQSSEAPEVTDTGIYFKINSAIDGDGSYSAIPIEKFNIKSESGFEITPDYSRYALLTANIKNLSKTILYAGVELFIDGKYSGLNYTQATPQGGNIVIPFGESKNISADKKKSIAKNQSSFMKGTIKDGYTIDVLNGLDKTVTVVINDRIPYAADSKISITNINIEPKAKTSKDGVYKWELSLKPRETKKISVNYEIKYPSDASIIIK